LFPKIRRKINIARRGSLEGIDTLLGEAGGKRYDAVRGWRVKIYVRY
jgi:hypothetical protein